MGGEQVDMSHEEYSLSNESLERTPKAMTLLGARRQMCALWARKTSWRNEYMVFDRDNYILSRLSCFEFSKNSQPLERERARVGASVVLGCKLDVSVFKFFL
jgi:hypothetical protein